MIGFAKVKQVYFDQVYGIKYQIKIEYKIHFTMNLMILILYCGYRYIKKRIFDDLLETEWFTKNKNKEKRFNRNIDEKSSL